MKKIVLFFTLLITQSFSTAADLKTSFLTVPAAIGLGAYASINYYFYKTFLDDYHYKTRNNKNAPLKKSTLLKMQISHTLSTCAGLAVGCYFYTRLISKPSVTSLLKEAQKMYNNNNSLLKKAVTPEEAQKAYIALRGAILPLKGLSTAACLGTMLTAAVARIATHHIITYFIQIPEDK